MTWLAAGVAATARGSAQTQSWAISLDVTETLAVVALLRCAHVSRCVSLQASMWVVSYSRWCVGVGSCWTRGLNAFVSFVVDMCVPISVESYLAACLIRWISLDEQCGEGASDTYSCSKGAQKRSRPLKDW
jgi:hypothetical protein